MSLDIGLITLALISGMAAVFSPCGIALLPAYIAMYFDKKENPNSNKLKKGILFGLTVTSAFLVVFLLIGLALSLFGRGLIIYTPWIALFLGFILVVLGVLMISGKNIIKANNAELKPPTLKAKTNKPAIIGPPQPMPKAL